jgi:hypothetical protein
MLKKAYAALKEIGKVAGALTFLFGIVYGIYQFFETQKQNEIAQTLAFYKEFNSAPISTYREAIFGAVAKHQNEIAAAAVDETKLADTMNKIIAQEALANQLMLTMDFFDGLVFCVTKKICDSETAVNLFHDRAREIYTTFYQYIVAQRAAWASNNFGLGLQTFAELNPPK